MVGFLDTIPRSPTGGIDFNAMFNGWGITRGIKNNLVKGLTHEFQYTQVFSFLEPNKNYNDFIR